MNCLKAGPYTTLLRGTVGCRNHAQLNTVVIATLELVQSRTISLSLVESLLLTWIELIVVKRNLLHRVVVLGSVLEETECLRLVFRIQSPLMSTVF